MGPCERDLKLIGGEFLTDTFPKEYAWMKHYFNTPLSERFAVYYLTFRKHFEYMSKEQFVRMFSEHTGIKCSLFLKTFMNKIHLMLEALDEAQRLRDLNLVTKIKSGEFNK